MSDTPNRIMRTVDGREYIFYGPNATLVHWMGTSDLASAVMGKAGLGEEVMFRALSTRNPEDGMLAGKAAIKALWYAWPELGPYPFLDTLSDFEFNREFYPDYREHVNHQLRVFWLGLYLFEMCGPIRERVLAEIGAGDAAAGVAEFLRRWCACAIYHDIGYVLECEGANEPGGAAWNRICQVVNDTLHAPLSGLPMFSERLGADAEHSAIDDIEIHRPKIKSLRSIELHKRQDLLDRIAGYGAGAGLGKSDGDGKSSFRRYYDYAMSHRPLGGGRDPFRDHGIGSAMLLMKIWSDFSEYVGKVSEAAAGHHLFQGVAEDVLGLKERLADAENSIVAAAGAIALHNITPSIWDRADTLGYDLTLHNNFCIRFHEDGLKGPLAAAPMAFLLGFADTLQTWDRPKFRALGKEDIPGLADQDMQLHVEEAKVFLAFREDERFKDAAADAESRFSKTRKNLKEYLDPKAIDQLLGLAEFEAIKTHYEPPERLYLSRLPETSPVLFGREKELKLLDAAWESPQTNIITLIAWGGVGKTSLVNGWLNGMERDNYRGARLVYGWSFYSQGAAEGKQASADPFFAHALEWFGDPDPKKGAAWDKGVRLAELVRQKKTLLILDGLEPLQYPSGEMKGKLKDQGLQALFKELARLNDGLCVITSRLALNELKSTVAECALVEGETVEVPGPCARLPLENLSVEAGVELLKSLGVKGRKDDLKEAVEAFGGHALALNLLGSFISVVHDGDIRRRDRIAKLTEEEEQGGHAKRVMESYKDWLSGTPELNILYLLGLFDRPAEGGAIEALKAEPVIEGLTNEIQGLTEAKWLYAVKRLRELRLIAQEDPQRKAILDCHPLIREYFGERLQKTNPDAWKEAHSSLYEYYKSVPEKELPDTLEEMEPLFAACAHGCMAERYQETIEDVYWERIKRKQEHYCTSKLGAFGSDLAALAGFFEEIWSKPASALNELFQAGVLNWAGFRLRALGRLREAAQPIQAGMESSIQQEDWKGAAQDAGNLSELWLTLGEVEKAVDYARQSVDFADRSGDDFQKESKRTTLADALHQAGDLEEAERLFREAEAMQKERQPQYPCLYSLQGFRFCDLLLSRGRYAEVLERAGQTLEWAEQNRAALLDHALNKLSLGRAHLHKTLAEASGDFTEAETWLNAAVNGLRESGRQDILPLGLLTRAELHRHRDDFIHAQADLAEVLEIAELSEMKLHLTDYHLESARLHLAMNHPDKAEPHRQQAQPLIEKTGYHRRDKDLAACREGINSHAIL